MLGEADKIVIVGNNVSGWALAVSPHLRAIPLVNSSREPNVEKFIELGVQVTFFWDSPAQTIQNLAAIGIPTVVTQQDAGGNLMSIDEFVEYQKQEVRLFGDTLGSAAQQKAEEWCAYFEDRVTFVRDRISTLPEDAIPRVYYVRGPASTTVHGKYSYTRWLTEIAGGDFVTKNADTDQILFDSNIEQILLWDPEVIFMGRVDNSNLILDDPAWQAVQAVIDGQIYVTPKGLMEWDYSSEGVLLMLFIAKTLHPQLFTDLDIKIETKDYFNRFYSYELSESELDLIMVHKDPA